jgi:UDP-N-acetylmuramyl pentapeptide phosphotransferase/UDP-N-acetylglucosamine-1-phosphate transferase
MISINYFYYLVILLVSIIFFSLFFKKKTFLTSFSGERHQLFTQKEKNIPLIGGLFLFFSISYILFSYSEFIFIFFLFLFLVLGICVDLKIFISPKKRIIAQSLLILALVYLLDLNIPDTRINFVDSLLNYKPLNILLVSFCLLVLLNGVNFIDGLNGLLIGYFCIVSFFLLKLNFFNFTAEETIIFFSTIVILFLFNFFNQIYLGDNGAYIFGIFFGVSLVSFHQVYQYISPYYIILLLWYPCFENLFSIIRKIKMKKSPMKPDTNHLHQVLFYYIKKKFPINQLYSNNLSSIIILIFNLIILSLGSLNIYSSSFQLIIILFSISAYLFSYNYFLSFKLKNK